MVPKSVTSRHHDHLVSVLFGDLLQYYIFNVFVYCFGYLFAFIFLGIKKVDG